MARLAPIAIALLFAASPVTVQAQEADLTKAGIAAAEQWLQTLDAGKIGQSWTESSASLRGMVTQAQWEAALRQARSPLGASQARKLVGARHTTSLPNAPAGEYVVIQYESTFAGRAGVAETVVPMREADGSWKVSGYFVK